MPYNATFFVPISPAEFKVKNRKYAEKDTSKIFGCYFFSILWKNCRWNLVLLFSPNEATAWYNLTVMTGIQYCSWGKRYELNMNEDKTPPYEWILFFYLLQIWVTLKYMWNIFGLLVIFHFLIIRKSVFLLFSGIRGRLNMFCSKKYQQLFREDKRWTIREDKTCNKKEE